MEFNSRDGGIEIKDGNGETAGMGRRRDRVANTEWNRMGRGKRGDGRVIRGREKSGGGKGGKAWGKGGAEGGGGGGQGGIYDELVRAG